MSKNKNLDLLKFPSGITVKQARKDAKKYRKEHGVSLSKAQDVIANQHGFSNGWSGAINEMQGSIIDTATFSTNSGKFVSIRQFGLSEIERRWFSGMPFVMEFLNSSIRESRKYGVLANHFSSDHDKARIEIDMDLSGLDSDQYIRYLKSMELDCFVGAISNYGRASKNKPKFQVNIESPKGEELIQFDGLMAGYIDFKYEENKIPIHTSDNYGTIPDWKYNRMFRTSDGYKVLLLNGKGKRYWVSISSKEFVFYSELYKHWGFQEAGFVGHIDKALLESINFYNAPMKILSDQLVLTPLSETLIYACGEVAHDLRMGRAVRPENEIKYQDNEELILQLMKFIKGWRDMTHESKLALFVELSHFKNPKKEDIEEALALIKIKESVLKNMRADINSFQDYLKL